MRRFYLAGSLIAMMLVCSIAPPPLEAGSGGKWEKSPGGKFSERFGGEMALPMEFPSFLRPGIAHTAAPTGQPHQSPMCWYEEALLAQPTNIVLLKARSSSFAIDPDFAPLAGLYKPPQAPLTPNLFPYSLMAVPQDGQFRYQATYTPAAYVPANLALACANFLHFDHFSVPAANPRSKEVTWDYRIGITDRHDQHEAKRNRNGWANDADQNPLTQDRAINRAQWVAPDGSWTERSLFWQSDTNHDREDWLGFTTHLEGQVELQIETGNGTWSNWIVEATVFDLQGQQVATTRSNSGRFTLSFPYQRGGIDAKVDPPWEYNYYWIQIYGSPKGKPLGSNVYFLPYKVSVRAIQK